MNDKDFEEIGRRLYDQEADPPENGWSKISAGIRVPEPAGKLAWLRKNFWIPLVLLLPGALYVLSGEISGNDSLTPVLVSTETRNAATDESISSKGNDDDERKSSDEVSRHLPVTEPESENTNATAADTQLAGTVQTTRPKNSFELKAEKYDADTKGEQEVRDFAVESREQVSTQSQEEIFSASAQYMSDTLKANSLEHVSTSDNQQATPQGSSFMLSELKIDSLVKRNEQRVTTDTVASPTHLAETKEEMKRNTWRISASFTPYYNSSAVRPVANDEVFVTDIEDRNRNFTDRINVGFAVGFGKSFSRNLYLDAHLTFSKSEQNTFYSYSTGNIDTLLAIQQDDQTVRVVPVYQETDRESSSKYTYGGVRLAATYYVLATPRGRFNVGAGVGINYLLSSEVKEKSDGQWITLSNEGLNKLNYSLTAGAGYNITFKRGWELMINPVLTYNLRQVKNNQLPYQLNQRPFGLNVMLSKTLGEM